MSRFNIPKRIMICRLGLLLVILAHALLFIGEVVPHAMLHRTSKIGGYGALLAVVIFRAVKPKKQKYTKRSNRWSRIVGSRK